MISDGPPFHRQSFHRQSFDRQSFHREPLPATRQTVYTPPLNAGHAIPAYWWPAR